MTTIGDLRDLVVIQKHGDGQDSLGQPVTGWVDVATVYALVCDLVGKKHDQMVSGAVQTLVMTRITVRYRRDIAAEMRVVRGTDVYVIQDVLDPTGRRTWMDLMCVRGVPDVAD